MKTTLLTLILGFSYLAHAGPESHTKATRELFQAMEVDKMTEAGLQQSVEMLLQQVDQPDKARPKIEKFMRETVGYKAIESEMVKLYQKHFNETEIQDMLKFYRGPTGKKLAGLQTTLFREGSNIGRARMAAKQDELQKILLEFRRK